MSRLRTLSFKIRLGDADDFNTLMTDVFQAELLRKKKTECDQIHVIDLGTRVMSLKLREEKDIQTGDVSYTVIKDKGNDDAAGRYRQNSIEVTRDVSQAEYVTLQKVHGDPDYVVTKDREIWRRDGNGKLLFYLDQNVSLGNADGHCESLPENFLEVQLRYDDAGQKHRMIMLLDSLRIASHIADETVEMRSYTEMAAQINLQQPR